VHILQERYTAARFTYSTTCHLSPGKEEEEKDGERPEVTIKGSNARTTTSTPITAWGQKTQKGHVHCQPL